MQAFIVDRYKSNSALRVGEMPEPEVRDNDVLVAIHAASLNQLDAKIRDGEFKLILPYRLPLILGNDVAGVVVRVGSRVRRFKPGDEAYARPDKDRIGAFADDRASGEVVCCSVCEGGERIYAGDTTAAQYCAGSSMRPE